MYQGKFDKKAKNSTADIHEITASRNAAAAAAAQKKASDKAPVQPEPKKRPVFDQESAPRKSVKPAKETAPQQPAKKAPRETVQAAEPRRKGPRLGGVIFYTIYFLFIFLFFVGTYFGLLWLQDWLVDFELSQPTTKAAEVFEAHFTDPDWGALYDAAGIADTEYEGKDAFVTYMENLVGDSTLTYQETSGGLSGKKYFVKLDDKRLAYFTMTETVLSENILTTISEWKLDEIGLFYERANGYRIQTVDGHVPLVNGVALTDDHIIQISTSKNDDSGFLPEGVTTAQSSIYEITDLIVQPTITVVDKDGNQMEVTQDETGMYVEQAKEVSISEEEKTVALNALKTYAKYQVKEASSIEVGNYFDSTGAAYKSIMQTVLTWTKGNNGIEFNNDTVSNYCRYSDTMFSAYVTTELTIKLTDGGSQTKPINATLLFSKTGGSWKVTKMSNANLAETVGKVRLTFMNGGMELSSDFYDINSDTLATPLLSVPAGKVFSGWYTETVKDNGSVERSLVFVPDANGDVTIASGTTLTPMVLYPLFENASAAAVAPTEGA